MKLCAAYNMLVAKMTITFGRGNLDNGMPSVVCVAYFTPIDQIRHFRSMNKISQKMEVR
jgi:hypothetical protein